MIVQLSFEKCLMAKVRPYRINLGKLKYGRVIRMERPYLELKNRVEFEGIRFHGATLWTDFSLFGNPVEVNTRLSTYFGVD